MKYPRKYICVQSASYPSEQLNYNELSQHIANSVPRSPLERMEDLLTERTYVR